MLINLLPDFLDILAQSDREAAYHRFLDAHRPLLAAYWNNYVLDLDSPHATSVIADAMRADRSDLHALLGAVDVARLVERTRCIGLKRSCRLIAPPTACSWWGWGRRMRESWW